jgi:sulfite dehydrogenase (quinone) subunit SoeC
MHPAFSVIFFTTLIGAGQGLFLALYTVEAASAVGWLEAPKSTGLHSAGSALALGLLGTGLLASFLHLGHPERAWRAAAMWRTSWLSREVIVLPGFMAAVAAYGGVHHLGGNGTLAIGAVGVALCIALFVCTGMIYVCIRFLQEWATPLTVVNYTLLGCASGFTLAAAVAAWTAPAAATLLAVAAIGLTLAGLVTRAASLVRNARLRPRSSLQTAIGIKHPRIVQVAQGFMGGSFNTREFFHGRTPALLRSVKGFFLVFAFALPVLLLAIGVGYGGAALFALAFVLQYAGLVAERWFFFAQANHPQNLYYQAIS